MRHVLPISPGLAVAAPRCWKGSLAALAVLAVGAIVAGCAAPADGARSAEPDPSLAGAGPLDDATLRALISDVAAKSRSLSTYTMTFTRWERRGFLRRLEGPEEISVWFRRTPHSVRMKWHDEKIKYGESVYVAGEHGDKVRFTTRWWSPPLRPPPQINLIDVMTPVWIGEARRPLTEFGLEKMMDRVEAAIIEAGADVTIDDRGMVALYPDGPQVQRLDLSYVAADKEFPRQTLYIHPDARLPAGVELFTRDGALDSRYFYEDIHPDADLTDLDFLLEAERTTAASQPTTAPDDTP